MMLLKITVIEIKKIPLENSLMTVSQVFTLEN